MLQDLAALAAPAIVCIGFAIGVWAVVRRELAPKRAERARANAADAGLGARDRPEDGN
jgi:hypothetical protein